MNHALTRLYLLGDWIKLKTRVNSDLLLQEISIFEKDWKQYNPRKNIKRMGLSVTSFDGELSGIPDLDSLSEYNKDHGTHLDNFSCTKTTEVYKNSTELQRLLKPFENHLLRSHFIKLDAGGFFPPHRDCYPDNASDKREQIRLIFFVDNCGHETFKFIYENEVIPIRDCDCFYFNGNKTHSVFSMKDNCIFLVVNLKFDEELYGIITKEMNDR